MTIKQSLILIFIFISFSLNAQDSLLIKIGTYENAPKIYTNENEEISGFWADIIYYIADKEGWNIEWVPGTWVQCLDRLEKGEIDIMPDVGISPERKNKFSFSEETVLLSWSRIYTRKGVILDSLMDLEGKKIAGLKGSFNIEGPEGLKDLINSFGLNCEIIELSNYTEVFEAIQNKEVFAGITNKDFGTSNELDYDIIRTPFIFQPARINFAFQKNSVNGQRLRIISDNYINILKGDNRSIYYTSLDRYLGGIEQVKIFPVWTIYLFTGIGGMIIISFILNWFLKQQINNKTLLLTEDILKREKMEKTLVESKTRFETLFTNTPVPVWEEDFSELFKYIDKLTNDGIRNFREYFHGNPDQLRLLIKKIKILDVNNACLALFKAKTKEELFQSIDLTFTEKSIAVFEEEIIALAEGKDIFESESELVNLKGELLYIDLRMSIINKKNNFQQALVTTIDITEKRKIELEINVHRRHLESLVSHRTNELEQKNQELERFNKLFVDREFRIKELRDKVKELERKIEI